MFRLFGILNAAVWTIFLVPTLAYPHFLFALAREDTWIENLSAAAFLLAGFIALWAFWRFRYSVFDRVLVALVAVGGFIGFLDEISFGQRLFDLEMPKVIGVELDATHDVVALFDKALRETMIQIAIITEMPTQQVYAFGYITVFIISAVGLLLLRKRIWALLSRSPIIVFMALMVVLGGIAQIMDLHILQRFVPTLKGSTFEILLVVIEELLEFSGAAALLFAALSAVKMHHAAVMEEKAHRFAVYGAIPVTAILVFAHQLYAQSFSGGSPWQGGGMGMFASSDFYDNRVLKIYLWDRHEQRGQPVVRLTDHLHSLYRQTVAVPTTNNLTRLARDIGEIKWKRRRGGIQAFKYDTGGKPIERLASRYDLLSPAGIRWGPPILEPWVAVNIELWKLHYNPASAKIESVRVKEFKHSIKK